MAEHRVQIEQLPEVEIANKDLKLTIYSAGETFGTLTVSRGGLGWYPKNALNERHFTWEQFERFVRDFKG